MRLPAQQMQGIGDIAGAAAKFAPQLRHKERDIQFMDLIGQDLVGKFAAKIHDAVKGQRAANYRCHCCFPVFLCKAGSVAVGIGG